MPVVLKVTHGFFALEMRTTHHYAGEVYASFLENEEPQGSSVSGCLGTLKEGYFDGPVG
jgi:hypothetical protein